MQKSREKFSNEAANNEGAPYKKLGQVKVRVKVKFTLEQATKAQRWSRGIALLFL
jgi:hypothetical protein